MSSGRGNILLRFGALPAVLLVLSAVFLPGQALEAGNPERCIRFISVPFIGWHEVPIWYARLSAIMFLSLLLVTIVTLHHG